MDTKQFFCELCVGDYIFIRDSYPKCGKLVERWKFKQLDAYWLQCVFNLGKGWSMPIELTADVIASFDEIEQLDENGTRFRLTSTPFYLVSLHDGSYSVETLPFVAISRVRYLHQLQNVFYWITGVPLTNLRVEGAVRIPVYR